jgi:hypothetical protein
MLPNSQFLKPITQAVQIYSTRFNAYRSLQAQVRKLNLEAAGEATMMAAAWIGTSLLLKSNKSDTRGLGYLSAGVLSIGLYFDIREYISRNHARKEARILRQEIESWDDNKTRQIIDSLSRVAPDSTRLGSEIGVK